MKCTESEQTEVVPFRLVSIMSLPDLEDADIASVLFWWQEAKTCKGLGVALIVLLCLSDDSFWTEEGLLLL